MSNLLDFDKALNAFHDFLKSENLNKPLSSKTLDDYCNRVKKINKSCNNQIMVWVKTALDKKINCGYNPTADIKDSFKNSCTHLKLSFDSNDQSAFNKFVSYVVAQFDGMMAVNALVDENEALKMVMQTAIFASTEVVQDVMNLKLPNHIQLPGGILTDYYASWYRLGYRRMTNAERQLGRRPSLGQNIWGEEIIGDENTYANSAIKYAIIASYKKFDSTCNINKSDFKNYVACHIWDCSRDEKYYTSIWNLVLLPKGIHSFSDHFPKIMEYLRYRSYELFEQYPCGVTRDRKSYQKPQKPKDYKEMSKYWRVMPWDK